MPGAGDRSLLLLLTAPQSVANSPTALCAPLCVSEADSLEQVAVGKGNCISQLCPSPWVGAGPFCFSSFV